MIILNLQLTIIHFRVPPACYHVLYLWRKPQFMKFFRILVHESDLFDRIVQIREDKIVF